MIAYRVEYLNDGDNEYYLNKETAFKNAAEYIYNTFEEEWPESDIKEAIEEFNSTGYLPDLCYVGEIVVDER